MKVTSELAVIQVIKTANSGERLLPPTSGKSLLSVDAFIVAFLRHQPRQTNIEGKFNFPPKNCEFYKRMLISYVGQSLAIS